MKLIPLRVIVATAPSGGQSRFVKYSEHDKELCFYTGRLTAIEEGQFWKAKLAAEKAGIEKWQAAAAILVAAGWKVEHE